MDRCTLRLACGLYLGATMAVWAADAGSGDLSIDVDVVSERHDEPRAQIQPSLGATVYQFSPEALRAIPQGDNAPLNQVLLQAYVAKSLLTRRSRAF